jgi:hypothetical protein
MDFVPRPLQKFLELALRRPTTFVGATRYCGDYKFLIPYYSGNRSDIDSPVPPGSFPAKSDLNTC